MNFSQTRKIAEAYQLAIEMNAELFGRDRRAEAFACLLGAADVLKLTPLERHRFIQTAIEDARESRPC